MSYAIKLLDCPGILDAAQEPLAFPCYVRAYDPDRHVLELTLDPNEALRWASPGDAIATWNMQSVSEPFRSDGRPNRPLTAFTVEIAHV